MNYSLLRSVEIPGSPLILLDAEPPPATKVLLCEQHDGARQALVNRCEAYGARADIHAGDANAVVHDMLTKVPRGAPAFAFLDPEGSELAWETVDAIAAHKRGQARKVEQLILFPTDMGFVRLAPDHPEMVTRILLRRFYGCAEDVLFPDAL